MMATNFNSKRLTKDHAQHSKLGMTFYPKSAPEAQLLRATETECRQMTLVKPLVLSFRSYEGSMKQAKRSLKRNPRWAIGVPLLWPSVSKIQP